MWHHQGGCHNHLGGDYLLRNYGNWNEYGFLSCFFICQKKTFEINSIVTKDNFLNLENLRSTDLYIFDLDSKNLQTIFNELFIFSDDVCIEIQQKLKFYTTNDTINTKYTINLTDTDNQNNNSSSLSKYSLNYLSKYKLLSSFENTTLKFNSNSPLLLVNKNEYIESHFILSPKIMDI